MSVIQREEGASAGHKTKLARGLTAHSSACFLVVMLPLLSAGICASRCAHRAGHSLRQAAQSVRPNKQTNKKKSRKKNRTCCPLLLIRIFFVCFVFRVRSLQLGHAILDGCLVRQLAAVDSSTAACAQLSRSGLLVAVASLRRCLCRRRRQSRRFQLWRHLLDDVRRLFAVFSHDRRVQVPGRMARGSPAGPVPAGRGRRRTALLALVRTPGSHADAVRVAAASPGRVELRPHVRAHRAHNHVLLHLAHPGGSAGHGRTAAAHLQESGVSTAICRSECSVQAFCISPVRLIHRLTRSLCSFFLFQACFF